MTIYNGMISNFIQGVSEQDRRHTFEGQVTVQDNCVSSVTEGIKKRPGTTILSTLDYSENGIGSANYAYERGDNEEAYYINVNGGTFRIRDLITGLQVAVTDGAVVPYLLTTDYERNIKFTTIGDTTFVLNASKKVAYTAATAPAKKNTYMIYCRKASYGTTYYINTDPGLLEGTPSGALAAYLTDSTATITSTEIDKTVSLSTHLVIGQLWTQLLTSLLDPVLEYGVTGSTYGDVIYLEAPANLALNLKATDTNHDNDIQLIHHEIDTADKLPNFAYGGYRVKVLGTDKTSYNDFYLEYITDSGVDTFGTGHWEECTDWGIKNTLDPATMPYKLVRQSNGTFLVSPNEWEPRGAGDLISNPDPSFVGSYISDLTTFQNRLVFTSSGNLCASVTDQYYNFFANTVTSSSDAEPIDSASSDNEITDLKHMVVFNGNLVLFSDKAQFFHPSDVPFITRNLNLAAKSKFSSKITVKPVASATSLFFPTYNQGYTNIRELSQDSLTNNIKSKLVTEHCKKYINTSPYQIVVSLNHDILFLRGASSNILFVYQWYMVGNELKQQAVHRWIFDNPITHMAILNNTLYLRTIENAERSNITYIDLEDIRTPGLDFEVRLDDKFVLEPSNYAVGMYSGLVPWMYADMDADEFTTVISSQCDALGTVTTDTAMYEGRLYIDRPVGGETTAPYPRFVIGKPFESRIEIINPNMHDQYNRAINGRLMLNQITFNFIESGYLKFTIDYYSRNELFNSYEIVFDGNIISGNEFVLNSPADILDEYFMLPIRGDAKDTVITLTSDSHLPFRITDASWSGQYNLRGRRTQ